MHAGTDVNAEDLALAQQRRNLAERRNAAATLAGVEPPFSPEQIRGLQYAVSDAQQSVDHGEAE